MTNTPELNTNALVRNSLVLSGAIGALAFVLTLAASIMGAIVLGADFAMGAAAIILAGAGLTIAAILLRAWENARWMLVETIAADIAKRDAEAAKIQAEAHAIEAAAERSTAQILNINAGSGTMNVKAKPITYRVNGQVVNGNQLNQIDAAPRVLQIDAADVRWFVEQLANGYGHSKAKWLAVRGEDGKTKPVELPYSRQPVTYDIYKALIDAITEAGGIVGRGERASGRLIETQPAQLVKMIEASYPDAGRNGITLELPAVTS